MSEPESAAAERCPMTDEQIDKFARSHVLIAPDEWDLIVQAKEANALRQQLAAAQDKAVAQIAEVGDRLAAVTEDRDNLQLQIDMSTEPCVIDEARWLDERNAGSTAMARLILDGAAGELAAGPCRDAIDHVRKLVERAEKAETQLEEVIAAHLEAARAVPQHCRVIVDGGVSLVKSIERMALR